MDIPTLDFVYEENLEDLAEELELKMNSSGEKLDLMCTLIESSIESVAIEFDSESSAIKFIAESDKHLLDVKIWLWVYRLLSRYLVNYYTRIA